MTSPTECLEVLALALRPEWAEPPHLGRLRQTLHDLRTVPADQLAGPLIRCYGDPETSSPGRLTATGPWWVSPRGVQSGRQGPFRADLLPPRGVSSPGARAVAKARLDAALHPKPAGNEGIENG